MFFMGKDNTIDSDREENPVGRAPWLALPEPISGSLTFARAFWVIAAALLTVQAFGIVLVFVYGFSDLESNYDYHLVSLLGGLAWYVIVTGVILIDMENKRVFAYRVLGLSRQKLQDAGPTVIKYFGIAAATMICLAIILPSDGIFPKTDSLLITVLVVLSAVVAAPICEEIWFRGYLYPAMFGQFKRVNERVVVNAMLFAAGHVFILAFFIGADVPYYIFIVGFLLAKLYETYRSILPCIVLHMFNNALALALDYIQPHTLLGLYD